MTVAVVVIFAAAGFLFGRLYFILLRYNIGLYLRADRRGRAVALNLSRLVAVIGFFVAAVLVGAGAALAGFGGFLAARTVAAAGLQ